MENRDRLSEHKKLERLEHLLDYFEKLLGPVEASELPKVVPCDEPILYIMGCARSGTSLVYEYLSRSGLFTYPTNFVSRFHYAPYLGARLQEMLFEADFRGEMLHEGGEEAFASRLGKTRGILSPHEFWYFWRRFFTFGEDQQLDEAGLDPTMGARFIRELRAFQSVAGLPLVLKGMILNWNIPYLASLYARSYFLWVTRATQTNAESLVRSRQEFFGDVRKWYSFKPPGYHRILHLQPHEQAIWQVLETNAAISEGLARLPVSQVFEVDYEAFCGSPRSIVEEICERWNVSMPHTMHDLPSSFEVHNRSDQVAVDWDCAINRARAFAVPRGGPAARE